MKAKEEHAVEVENSIEKMMQPGPTEDGFFAKRRQLGLGVGLDEHGNLVRESKGRP